MNDEVSPAESLGSKRNYFEPEIDGWDIRDSSHTAVYHTKICDDTINFPLDDFDKPQQILKSIQNGSRQYLDVHHLDFEDQSPTMLDFDEVTGARGSSENCRAAGSIGRASSTTEV